MRNLKSPDVDFRHVSRRLSSELHCPIPIPVYFSRLTNA